MTKTEMVDQIEFVLSELADVHIELRRIDAAQIDGPRPGELHAETVARTLGQCQEMAHNAEIFLSLAVDNLRQCLSDPNKPIPPFFATRAGNTLAGLGPDYPLSTRTSHPNLAAQPPFKPKGESE